MNRSYETQRKYLLVFIEWRPKERMYSRMYSEEIGKISKLGIQRQTTISVLVGSSLRFHFAGGTIK